MAGSEIRNPDGSFAPGNVSNPEGKNGHAVGWTRYSDRVQKLSEKYTQAQILEYAIDDAKRTVELSYWDALCIVHMARAIERRLTVTDSGADHVNKEREALIDRFEGKAIQRNELTGKDGGPIDVTSEHREAVLSKLLSPAPIGDTETKA